MKRLAIFKHDGPWRRTAIAVAVAAILSTAINIAFWAYISRNPVNTGIGRVWQKWQMLERMQAPVDWVIVGDSTCGQSVRPDIIESESGQSAVNFCTVGNALAVNGAWQVERYIDRFGSPKRVVALFTFETYERDTTDLKSLLGQIPLSYGFWRRKQPSLDLTLREEVQKLLLPVYSLYSYNLSAKALLRNLADGQAASTAWRDLEGIEREKGFVMESRGDPERAVRESAAAAARAAGRQFKMTPENEAALRQLVALSDRYGFELYIANAPISARLYADEGFRTYFSQVNAVLASIAKSGKRSHLIFAEPPQFPDDQLADFEHIIGEAATKGLTHSLVAEINRATAAGQRRE